jgi:hypothetical protein
MKRKMGAARTAALRVFAGRSGSSGAVACAAAATLVPAAAPETPATLATDREAECPPSTSSSSPASWEVATLLPDYADAAEV